MLLINFSHSLTKPQISEINKRLSKKVDQIVTCEVHFDNDQDFSDQVRKLFGSGRIPTDRFQKEPFLVILPSHSFIAGLVLAELHGRMGHFPAVVRISPETSNLPLVYRVAEIIDLQAVRDNARKDR